MRERTDRLGRRLAIVLLVGWVFLGASCRDKAERRQVVLYCSVDQEVAEPIVARFEEQSGVEVLARYDTEASKTVGLVQRIRSEASAPTADVFWSSEVFYTIRLAREGLFTPYQGPQTEDRPAGFADPNGLWHGFALRARVIGYNSNRVTAQEAPKSLEDLLEAKWKGRLVMASPAFGTTGGDVASWFAHYGPTRARQILAGLKANEVRLVSGNSTAVRLVATGQADLCLTDTDDVYAGQRNGWPVAMNPLDQGGEGVLAIPNTAALVKGGPHPHAARELMAFLLSQTPERMLVESDSHNGPLHPAVAAEYPQYAIAGPLAVDYVKVAEHLPTAIETAREMLQ